MFKSIGKGFDRTRQKLAVAVGSSSATSDHEFTEARNEFKKYEAQVKKIQATTRRYVQACAAMHKAQLQLTTELCQLYADFGPHDPGCEDMSIPAVHSKTLSESLDLSNQQLMGEKLNERYLTPLANYLKQLQEVDKKIEVRKSKAVDMDRYQRRFQGCDQARNAEEYNRMEDKVRSTTAEYDVANRELLRDIPHVISHRSQFFNCLLAALHQTEKEYFSAISGHLDKILPEYAHIDTNFAHTYDPLAGMAPLAAPTSTPSSAAAPSPYAQQQQQQQQAPPQQGYAPSPYGQAPPQQQPAAYGAAPSPYGQAPPPQQQQQQPYGAARGGYGAPARGRGGYGAPPRGRGAGGAPSRSAPARPPARPAARTCRALYDFAAQEANELSFRTGDVITVIQGNPGDEWWQGELNGARGLFPSSYVQ